HKFDPITTRDFYALSGYLKSSRHQHAFIDSPAAIAARAAELHRLKETVRSRVEASGPGNPFAASELPWDAPAERASGGDGSVVFEDFARPAFDGWSVSGDAFGTGPTRAGDWLIRCDTGAAHATKAAPGIAHSGLVADRLQGVLRSRTFVIEKRFLN